MVAVQMASPASTSARFRVGRVLSQAFKVYFRNFIWVNIVSLATFALMGGAVFGVVYTTTRTMPDPLTRALSSFVILFIFVLIYMTGASIVMHGVLQYMRDGRARVVEALGRGFARAPVLILMGIVVGIVLILLSSILMAIVMGIASNFYRLPSANVLALMSPREMAPFIIMILIAFSPAFYFMVMWNVAVPACVSEELGPIRSLGRSRKLTKGFRWRIALLVIITFALAWVPKPFEWLAQQNGLNGWPVVVAFYGIALVIHSFQFVLPCATFVALRQAKEGRDIQQLANVFE